MNTQWIASLSGIGLGLLAVFIASWDPGMPAVEPEVSPQVQAWPVLPLAASVYGVR